MNGQCEAVLCGKTLGSKPITVLHEGQVRKYHDVGCALEAILFSLKEIQYQIEGLQKQLKQ